MTNLTRRMPIETPLARMFSQMFSDQFADGGQLAMLEEGTLPLDVSEDDKNVIVRASLPGFRPEDITVEVRDGILSINAQHSEELEEEDETYYRRERRFGAVSRRVALPSTVLEQETQAELKDGVLTIRVPKSPKAMPRKIQIRDGGGRSESRGQVGVNQPASESRGQGGVNQPASEGRGQGGANQPASQGRGQGGS